MTNRKPKVTIVDDEALPPISDKRLAEIGAIDDDQIDLSDVPEPDEAWFASAKVRTSKGSSAGTERPSQANE